MLQSPSKFSPRSFLRSLIENNFISSEGVEYDEQEVRELLIEKETSLSLSDYANELRALESGEFEGFEKSCQEIVRCELISANIIFPLPVNYSFGEIVSTTTVESTERLTKLDMTEIKHQSIASAPVMSGAGADAAKRRDRVPKCPGKVLSEKDLKKELAEIDDFLESGIDLLLEKTYPALFKREPIKKAGHARKK